MKVRLYRPDDWPEIVTWFTSRGWQDIQILLPVHGWVVEEDGKLLAACWLYTMDALLCLLEWSVTNPEFKGVKSLNALTLAIDAAKDFARANGYASMIQFLRDERLVNYYEKRLRFEPTEKATLMHCNLGG